MSLPLDDIVRITVNLSPRAAARRGFNLALIIGKSEVIPESERVRLYQSTAAMLADGFTPDSPEYKAARLIFSQRPAPHRIAVGRHVLPGTHGLTEFAVSGYFEAAQNDNDYDFKGDYDNAVYDCPDSGEPPVLYEVTLHIEHTPAPGNSLIWRMTEELPETPAAGQVLIFNADGWSPAEFANNILFENILPYIEVAEINPNHEVAAYGLAHAVNGTITPLSLGLPLAESAADAVRACRAADSEWYMVSYLDATSDEILAIAHVTEQTGPACIQFCTTDEPLIFINSPDSVFNKLRERRFRRTIGQYSKTPYAVCGIMGYAAGANTNTARGAYTLMHTQVAGIPPDNLSLSQVNAIRHLNGNVYVARGYNGDYAMFEAGTMSDGTWFDEMLHLDMLVNDLQLAVLDLLIARPKIPQTESGVNTIKLAMTPSLVRSRRIGFIAPGKWHGPDIYITHDYAPLQTGDMLADGYMILSEPVSSQTQAEREARIAPPVYIPIKLAGAIHSVIVRIDVNR